MNTESLEHDRLTITSDPMQLEVTIRRERQIFATAFIGFWLCGWAFGEVTVLSVLLSSGLEGGSLFLLFWLAAWTIGGAIALGTFLWGISGREEITAAFGELLITRRMIGWRRSRRYQLSSVTNLRYDATTSGFSRGNDMSSSGSMMSAFTAGNLKFDYGHKTVGFGFGLDEPAVHHLIALLEPFRDAQASEDLKKRKDSFAVPEVSRS